MKLILWCFIRPWNNTYDHSIQVIVLLLLCKFHVNFLFLKSLKMDLTKCNVQALIKFFYILKLWSFKLKFLSIPWNSHKSPSEAPSSNFIWPLPAESSCWPKVLQWGKCLHWWWWFLIQCKTLQAILIQASLCFHVLHHHARTQRAYMMPGMYPKIVRRRHIQNSICQRKNPNNFKASSTIWSRTFMNPAELWAKTGKLLALQSL